MVLVFATFYLLTSSPSAPSLFSTTWSVWPALFLQMLFALGFLSPAHLCPMLVLPPSMVLPCGALSFTAPKMKDLQLLVMSRTLYSPKPVQLPCKAPVSASSRLGSWTQEEWALERSSTRKAAAFMRDQALQELSLQQLWAFWDFSQYQLLIGSSWGLNLLSPAG